MNIEDFTYTPEEKEAFFKHFMNIWEIFPDDLKHRFLRERKCVLCNECTMTIEQVQAAIRADKEAKRNSQDNNS